MFTTRAGLTPDLGHEPPLDASGSNAEFIDRREVSLRWLGASVLVGVTGGALIGASIYIAFQGLTSLVQQPQRAKALSYYSQDQDDKAATAVRKGDKLVRHESTAAESKDGIRIPITIKVGDREVIKMRRFMRIATLMSPTTGLYATNIPPFNPMKLMAQGGEETRLPEPPPEVSDADVSVTRANLTDIVFGDRQPSLNDDDALAQLEAERSLLQQRGQRTGLPISSQFMLSRPLPNVGQLEDIAGQSFGGSGLFSGIEIRVIPENVTNLAKSNAPSPIDLDERELTLMKGETLSSMLLTTGATDAQVASILKTLQSSIRTSSIGEGQKVRVLSGNGQGPDGRPQVLRVSVLVDRSVAAIAAMNDRGNYVSVAPSNDEGNGSNNIQVAEEDEPEANERLSTARLYESLFETAAKNNVPPSMVDDIVRIFGSDVDFQRRVTPSDSIEILYALDDDANDRPEMQYAAFTTGGETRKVYRYQGEDGNVDYLDDQGRSLKRFLLRKPITDAIMRSTFGMRRHPVLGYSKLHSGVDWANKIGTPILAAGNGVVVKAAWQSGYGQRVEIQHANGYLTTYSHMSRFAVGVSAGIRVRQGQVIGYVGNTGLSTGPHLHYEVKVNDHFVDPMKIRVPRGRELDGRALAEFKRQQEQVNTVLEKSGSSVRMARGGID